VITRVLQRQNKEAEESEELEARGKKKPKERKGPKDLKIL
jgi:hypothetical protein